MSYSRVGLELSKSDLRKIVKKLESLPKGVQRNAATSALNAGARVIRDKARARAPGCLRKSIKNVRLKQENGDPVTAIAAGVGMKKPDQGYLRHFSSRLKGRQPPPCVAVWIEFGTYGRRNLGKNPYAPSTMRKYSKTGGRSPSPYWGFPTRWIPAQPFLRPAFLEASEDGSVERAMADQFDKYFRKLGV